MKMKQLFTFCSMLFLLSTAVAYAYPQYASSPTNPGVVCAKCHDDGRTWVAHTTTVIATAKAGTGGSVTPSSRSIKSGSTASFPVTTNTGYIRSSTVGGTCPAGIWSGETYTTGAIASNCSISFSFTPQNIVPASAPSNINVPPSDADGNYIVSWTASTTIDKTKTL